LSRWRRARDRAGIVGTEIWSRNRQRLAYYLRLWA
jgi:hypothetical protein